jgi:DNA-binding SARP family transcriptional activator
LVALKQHPVLRAEAAGVLWGDTAEGRAQASLRTALWRLQRVNDGVLEATASDLRLSSGVELDVREMTAAVRALGDLGPDSEEFDLDLLAGGELLPGWYDDWVIMERERLQMLRLRALLALAERRRLAGQLEEAEAACRAALAIEPLRESAQRALITVLVARGDRAEAMRAYRAHRALLRTELDVEPAPETQALVGSWVDTDGWVDRGQVAADGMGSADDRGAMFLIHARREERVVVARIAADQNASRRDERRPERRS